jgi:hypothetical protein
MHLVNKQADARAKSLQLKPRPRQNNGFKHFQYPSAMTDSDYVEVERIRRCLELK